MFRITVDEEVDSIALRLEGKLVGECVQELRAVWSKVQSMSKEKNVSVCLTEISTVDVSGRVLLSEIHSCGGVLTGSGLLARGLIESVTSA